jgi:hypothetical protein
VEIVELLLKPSNWGDLAGDFLLLATVSCAVASGKDLRRRCRLHQRSTSTSEGNWQSYNRMSPKEDGREFPSQLHGSDLPSTCGTVVSQTSACLLPKLLRASTLYAR